MTVQDFVQKFYPFAKAVTAGTGISPYLILAQARLEGMSSKKPGQLSELAAKHNNFFGVKVYPGYQGKSVTMRTAEQKKDGTIFFENARFVAFNNPGESFAHQIKFLQSQPRYRRAGLFDKPNDYKHQADTLQRAGYATDINYAQKLTQVANTMINQARKLAQNAPILPALLLVPLLFFF